MCDELRNELKSLIQGDQKSYLQLLQDEIREEIKQKIKNFIKNFYSKFSKVQKKKFQNILSSINNPEVLHNFKKIIDVMDFQLFEIKLYKNNDDVNKNDENIMCRVESRYPEISELYNELIFKKIDYKLKTHSNLIEILSIKNDRQNVGIKFENAINFYLSSFIKSSQNIVQRDIYELNKLKKVKEIDKFDLFDFNYTNIYILFMKLFQGIFFTNLSLNHEKIDGGFIYAKKFNENELEFDLITYDATIADKSNNMIDTIKAINEKIDSNFQEKIRSYYLKLLEEELSLKINFVKHYFIIGVKVADPQLMILHPETSLELNNKHKDNLNKVEKSLKDLDKSAESKILKEKLGILSASIIYDEEKKEDKDDKSLKILTLKLEEIKY